VVKGVGESSFKFFMYHILKLFFYYSDQIQLIVLTHCTSVGVHTCSTLQLQNQVTAMPAPPPICSILYSLVHVYKTCTCTYG